LLLLDTTFLIDAERGANRMDDLIADDDDTAIARDHGRRAVRRRPVGYWEASSRQARLRECRRGDHPDHRL
jgi:hypothetical protein